MHYNCNLQIYSFTNLKYDSTRVINYDCRPLIRLTTVIILWALFTSLHSYWLENCLNYGCRVVNYDRGMLIRLTTGREKMVFQFWSQVEGRRIRIDFLEAGLVKIFSSSDKKLKHILLHCQMISSQFCYIAKWSLHNFATLSSKCFLHLQINVFKFATMPNKFFTFLLLCQMSSLHFSTLPNKSASISVLSKWNRN